MVLSILMGLPGSGKSTWTERNVSKDAVIASADAFFVGSDGAYRFDPTKLGEAHGACFRAAVEGLRSEKDVVVDNTNTSAVELAPYLALGQAYGAAVHVILFEVDVDSAARRNTHGVPLHALKGMQARLSETLDQWPCFWPAVQRSE